MYLEVPLSVKKTAKQDLPIKPGSADPFVVLAQPGAGTKLIVPAVSGGKKSDVGRDPMHE